MRLTRRIPAALAAPALAPTGSDARADEPVAGFAQPGAGR